MPATTASATSSGSTTGNCWRSCGGTSTRRQVPHGWALVEARQGYTPTPAAGTTWRVAIAVFVIGDGEDFDAP